MRSRRQDSFKTFEANTSDAWDDGDDDLMKLGSAARQNLSRKNVKSVCDASSDDSANVNSSLSELSGPFVSSSGVYYDTLFNLVTVHNILSMHCTCAFLN